jgi:Undecaprenyl-phosphate galactose phosphotransferase WbaP
MLSQPVRNGLRILLKKMDAAQIPAVLIGTTETARLVSATLEQDAYTGFKVVDDADVAVACEDVRMFKCEMPELARKYRHIVFVPSGASFPVFGAQAVAFDGLAALEMVNQRRMRALRIEKSVLDYLLAVTAFVLLTPFFLLVPMLIKLTSHGPVFYRQTRLGKKGRPIRVWKFRSMYADADARLKAILDADPARRAEWEANFKLADDPRVTPLGRFLRKTSIDEFPQLFNVFAGDMALVGPRPIVDDEVPYYGAAYETFSSVKPGITGLWQASGRSDTDYARRVALDTYYVLNWSPWMDIWILFRTVGAVLFMRGAC